MKTTYTSGSKMADLLAAEPQALRIISRFQLPLGVDDLTIDEVCTQAGVHTATFLAIVNYKIGAEQSFDFEDISLTTLLSYLRQSHTHFFDFTLPMLRRKLIEAVNYSISNSRIPVLIIQYFDQYVSEISVHMQHENEEVFPYVESLLAGKKKKNYNIEHFAKHHRAVDDLNIAAKLSELKNLIIKYYPKIPDYSLLLSVLYDLFLTEQDIATHCAIEDNILLPAVRNLELSTSLQSANTNEKNGQEQRQEELSEREKDVLIEVVKGLSNKEIANKLFISIHTVITHRKNITRKLNIHSTAGLTIYAIVNNLIDIDSLQDKS